MAAVEKEKWCCSGCAQKRVCTVCGNVTEWACSDCRMDLECTIYVCNRTACRNAHEEKCPHILAERIAALERKLASLEWTPITPENLPTKDDEVLGLGSVFLFEDAYDPNEPPPTAEAWIKQGYTHRRPTSLPVEMK